MWDRTSAAGRSEFHAPSEGQPRHARRRPLLLQAVEEGTILGPRLLFTGHALSQTGGHGDMRGK